MPHDTPSIDTLAHLSEHHGDFAAFRDLMLQTSAGRFGPIFWGVFDQYVQPRLPDAPRLLDVGCGPGGLFEPMRAHVPGSTIVGIEVQPAMLEAARERATALGDVEIHEADLAAPLPLADASIDGAVASMVLHEMPYPVQLLRELGRVLKPGAPLLVFDWVRQPLAEYAGQDEMTPGLLQHFREHCLYTPEDLAYLCELCGLHVLEVVGRRGNRHAMLACVNGERS